jgi:hypothetical protein
MGTLLLLCLLLSLVCALPDNSPSPLSSSKLLLPLKAVANSACRLYNHTTKRDILDMVQIAALCSVLPAFWYLRGRRRKGKSLSCSSTDASLNGAAKKLTPRNSVDINGKLCCGRRFYYTSLTSRIRDRSRRPRSFEKAFRDTILHHESVYLFLSPSLLQQARASRQVTYEACAFTSTRIHPRIRRFGLTIQSFVDEPCQSCILPIN